MKKIRYIICVAMAAIMLLAAAGCQNGSGETAAEPANTEEPSAEAPADQSEYAAKADEAYKAAVEKLVNDKVFPNGEDTGFEADSFFGDMDENKYAIADVDSDGKDELIISFTTAPVAGEVEQVYGYNDADGTLKLKLNEFPLVTYYTNGIAEVGWSHNQGWAGDRLWPYSLFFYNADKDEYEIRYSIDAWDKTLADKDADGNPYPEDVDKNGDGYVVILTEGAESKYMSAEDYEAWRKEIMGDAKAIDVKYQSVTGGAAAETTETAADDANGIVASVLDDMQTLEVGTAGSSLKAVAKAAQLLNWCQTTQLDTGAIRTATTAWLADKGQDVQAAFSEQMTAIKGACEQLKGADAKDILESAGVADAGRWTDAAFEKVQAMMEAIGVE